MAVQEVIGRQIDHYSIQQPIGSGALSAVYLATDVYLGRQVALKVLDIDIQDKALLTRFQRDLEIVSRLHGPNIVRIYTIGATPEGHPYLATQYIRGGSLKRQLAARREQFTLHKGLMIGREIALALQEAHQAGVIHGNLKPSDILLHPDDTPVLSDLGLAAVWQEKAIVARPAYYASPEQLNGNPIDHRSDIYSLGVIMRELLSGRPPFEEATQPILVPQQGDEQPTLPPHGLPGLSRATNDLLSGCLEQNSELRFQSALQLVEAIDQALIEEGFKVPDTPRRSATPARPPAPPAMYPAAHPAEQAAGRSPAYPKQLIWALIGLLVFLLILFAFVRFSTLLSTNASDNPATAAAQSPTEPPLSSPPSSPSASAPNETPSAQENVPPLLPTPTLVAALTSDPSEPQPQPSELPPPVITSIAPPTPEGATAAADVAAIRLTSPPNIDGVLDEWAAVTPILVSYQVYQDESWDGTDDLTATWRIGWDEQSLYLAVSVLDDTHVQSQTGNQIFRGDSVEVQIDADRAGDFGPELNADDFQLTFSPGDFTSLPPSAYLWQGEGNQLVGVSAENIVVESVQTEEGYNLEAAVLWSDLGIVSPTAGLVIGVALNATDNDQLGEAVQEVFKSHVETRLFADPTTWGTLTLE